MSSPILVAWRWRSSVIDEVHGDVALCPGAMRRRVQAQRVPVRTTSRGKVSDLGYAWGQFLDSEHHSESHWGRFGTSAAVQVLAMDLHWTPDESRRRRVHEVHPLPMLAKGVLPAEVPDDLPKELKGEDFNDPMKVAFVVDALELDVCDEVVQGPHPEMVDHLVSMAVDDRGWSTRPATDEDRSQKDRLLITAYSLYVLRRFPIAQGASEIRGAWGWLAKQVTDARTTLGYDVLALSALALSHAPEELRTQTVAFGIDTCRRELEKWATELEHASVERPYFNSYTCDGDHDYIFLSPEILAALFFLKIGNPRSTRSFVLWVVQAVADNVMPRYLRMAGPAPERGFSVQRTMEGTVDQMWALRLLRAFHLQYVANKRVLRPSRVGWPGAIALLSTIGVAILAFGVLVLDKGSEAFALSVGSAVLGAALGVVAIDLRASRA